MSTATSESKEKCHFFYKIGACRHGDKCLKLHLRPARSHTIVLHNLLYIPDDGIDFQSFDQFYEDIYIEACKFGLIRSMIVCENRNHLRGNVYLYYEKETDAQRARDSFNTRWYDERPVYCDLTHIEDFRESICRKHDTKSCERGNECNFMHIRRPSTKLRIDLEKSQAKKVQSKGS